MTSLNTISWRGLTRRKGRYALTALGTALGVAVLFGVLVATNATSASLDKSIRESWGDTDVSINAVGSYDAVLPPGLPDAAAQLDGVESVVPYVFIRSSLRLGTSGDRRPGDRVDSFVFIDGIAMEAARTTFHLELMAGRWPAPGQPEIAIPDALAKSLNLRVGSVAQLTVPSGVRDLAVVAVLNDGNGLGAGQSVIYTSVEQARSLLGKGDVYTATDVLLEDGIDPKAWIDTHRDALGQNVSVQAVSDAGAGFKQFVASVNGALTLICFIALFVGAFLIFLTFSLAVAERTRMWGTLRALGASPRQVRRIVLVESALLGFASTFVGLGLGMIVARGVVGLTSSLLGIPVDSLGVPVVEAAISVTIAMLVSLAAAWLPARRAAALSPITAMREGLVDSARAPRPWLGGALLAVGIPLGMSSVRVSLRALGALVVLTGAVVIVPWLLRPVAQVLGTMTRRIARGVGPIAVLHLVKERSRSAYTLALIMVVLAMILAVGASNLAIRRTIDEVVTRQAGSDLAIFAPGAFDPAVGQELEAMEEIELVSPLRLGQTQISLGDGKSEPSQVLVIDPATYFEMASFAYVKGNDARTRDALAKGGHVLLPDGVAERLDLKVGGEVSVRTSRGLEPFVVAGTYAMVGNGFGVIAGIADVERFGNGRPNAYFANAKDGIDRETLRNTVMTRLSPRYELNIDTPELTLANAHAQLRGFFSLGYAILFIAAVIGFLGLANTLVVSVLTRTREIGMLRSTGVLRRQVRRMVLVEAVTLAAVAFVLAIPLGWILSAGIISGQRAQLGFSIDYVFPWGMVVPLAAIALVLAAVASLIPAGRASRMQVVSALRFD